MTKLKPGQKYLSIKLAGHDFVTAFPNEKTADNQPDYKGDGVAVWIREKQEETKLIEEKLI